MDEYDRLMREMRRENRTPDADGLLWCKSAGCDRKTSGALYCCSPCAAADEGRYEIHAHSAGCDKRHAARAVERPA